MRRLLAFVSILSVLSSCPEAICAGDSSRDKGIFEGGGKKWAVCIGVSDYKDAGIMGLRNAGNDAKGLAQVLEEHGAFDHVMVLSDDLGARNTLYPSRPHILALFHKIAKQVRPEDLLVFSFSGHGFTDASGRSYLLTADARTASPWDTALAVDEVLEFIRKTGVKRSLLFLDAARERVRRKGSAAGGGVYPDRYLRRGVSAVFYAARKGYYSHDDLPSEYGLFGNALITGLQGEADTRYGGNKDGVVSLGEIASYVDQSLTDWSLKGPQVQFPYTGILDSGLANMMVSSAEKIGVARVLTPPRSEVRTIARREKKETEKKVTVKEESKKKARKETPDTVDKKTAAVVGAPAPRIEDLVKEERADRDHKETRRTQKAAEVRETEKPKETMPPKVAESTAAVGAPAPTIEELAGEQKAEVAKKEELRKTPAAEVKQEPPPTGETKTALKTDEPETRPGAPAVEGPKEEKAPEKVAFIPPQPRKPVRLRAKPRDLSSEAVKSMLTTHRFYATCWNYNSDFCNPDGDFENQFQENPDGTVTDKATGLMWQKEGSRDTLTWIAAREYADRVNGGRFAGFSDWRIPTAEELASLMESSWKNGDLFIDKVFDREQRHCWSQDTRGMESAWKANFHQGFLLDFPMTSKNSVRLVRSVK